MLNRNQTIRRLFIVTMLSLNMAAWSQDNLSIDDLLALAEQVKSADPVRFADILDVLQASRSDMDADQRQNLDLLRGYQHHLSGEVHDAEALYLGVIDEVPMTEIRYKAHYLIANLYAFTRNFEGALFHLDQFIGLSDIILNQTVRQNGLLNAAIIYNQLQQYEQAQEYSADLIENTAIDRILCIAIAINTEASLHLTGLSAQTSLTQRGIDTCERISENVPANFIRTYQARHWLNQGELDAALTLLLSYLDEVEERNYPRLSAEYYALLSQTYSRLGNLETATDYAQLSLQASEQQPYSLPVVASLTVLSEVSETAGSLQQALAYRKQLATADLAYLNEVSAKNLAYQMAVNKLHEKTAEIELLNKENQLLQLHKNLDREAAENTRLLLSLLTAIIAFIGLWAFRTKRNQVLLKKMAQCDSLTGAFNRRHFYEVAQQHLRVARNHQAAISLVLFDLDHFKSINDAHGHPVGDWVLQETINVCRQFCRENDVFGRLGGEEFGVLLPGCDKDSAVTFAERCRKAITQISTSPAGKTLSVSASFGIAEGRTHGYVLKDLVSLADNALYAAKAIGRNSVMMADDQDSVDAEPELKRSVNGI